jgi:hypothetical protein
MRGDQSTRQRRIIRSIEASTNGLTVAEIATREETGIRTIYRDLQALHPKCHAKAQSAPREIFRLLLPFLHIFSTPWSLTGAPPIFSYFIKCYFLKIRLTLINSYFMMAE